MVTSDKHELDVVGMVEDDLEAAFQVFFVRRGRVTGRKGFIVDKVEDLETPELMSRFLERLYLENEVPKQVTRPGASRTKETSSKSGCGRSGRSKVKVLRPAARREAVVASDRHRERQGGVHATPTEAIE